MNISVLYIRSSLVLKKCFRSKKPRKGAMRSLPKKNPISASLIRFRQNLSIILWIVSVNLPGATQEVWGGATHSGYGPEAYPMSRGMSTNMFLSWWVWSTKCGLVGVVFHHDPPWEDRLEFRECHNSDPSIIRINDLVHFQKAWFMQRVTWYYSERGHAFCLRIDEEKWTLHSDNNNSWKLMTWENIHGNPWL